MDMKAGTDTRRMAVLQFTCHVMNWKISHRTNPSNRIGTVVQVVDTS